MATPVIIPKIEMVQEKATIVGWLKSEGDAVDKGEALLEVETDKVTMQVEAPASGVLAGLRGEPGAAIPVTETIAYVLKPGEKLPRDTGRKARNGPKPAADTAAPERARTRTPASKPEGNADATPVARRLAQAAGIPLCDVRGTGPRGRVTRSDVEMAVAGSGDIDVVPGKLRATPAARRVARTQGVDLLAVSASGPKGRVQADDVRAFVEEREEAAPSDAEVVPLKGMRRTIAERMARSFRTAPHITLGLDVDMGAFEAERERRNARARAGRQPQVSVTTLLVKAVAWALARHPWLNSTLRNGEIHILPDINVGVAVALESGLIVPVVKTADQKDVEQIAVEIKELVDRAQENRLRPSDVAGGTFTISNLGPFGIETFTAIINPPEAAILAVGATRSRIVPDGEGSAVERPMMHLSLSADHRIVDGATAARFLSDLRQGLEDPRLFLA